MALVGGQIMLPGGGVSGYFVPVGVVRKYCVPGVGRDGYLVVV